MTIDELRESVLKTPGLYMVKTSFGGSTCVMGFEVADDLQCYQISISTTFERDGVLPPTGWNEFALKNATVRGPFLSMRNFKHAIGNL